MALINEEFIRCEKCGHPEFKAEEVMTLSKTLRPRDNKKEALPALDKEINYKCAKCGHELNR
jgi:DNA-directed RNA polymerase subunit RPC12/RpoP